MIMNKCNEISFVLYKKRRTLLLSKSFYIKPKFSLIYVLLSQTDQEIKLVFPMLIFVFIYHW